MARAAAGPTHRRCYPRPPQGLPGIAARAGSATRESTGASAEPPLVAQQREHPPGGLGAMADAVLDVGRELGDGLAERGNENERVVAEAAVAARRIEHLEVPAADREQRLGVVGAAHRDDRADEARAAIGDAAQAVDQERVVGSVLDAAVA